MIPYKMYHVRSSTANLFLTHCQEKMSFSQNPYVYSMDTVQPLGATIYADAPAQGEVVSGGPAPPTSSGTLVIPRTDHLPVLPDAGGVTDIVSATGETPWFADSKPDLRSEAYEKPNC